MDSQNYSTLFAAVKHVPDPRKLRGKRYVWTDLLMVICGALVSGQKSGRAIAEWGQDHAGELLPQMASRRGRLPSEPTVRRAIRQMDVAALEQNLAQFNPGCQEGQAPTSLEPRQPREPLRGQAIDGKAVRGVNKYGQSCFLVSVVAHDSGQVLAQTQVSGKGHEAAGLTTLLQGWDLSGTVTTVDALHTRRKVAAQILAAGGDYLMVVKANQPELCAAIAQLFERPPWLKQEWATEYQVFHTCDKQHGRLETRTLESSTTLRDYLDWPGGAQVMRRTCKRIVLKSQKESTEITYGITSLGPQKADAETLEHLWRGHWTIENKVHYVRDVTLEEDKCRIWAGHAPQVLASLRNGVLTLLRQRGWKNIARALRYYAAFPSRALEVIGALSP